MLNVLICFAAGAAVLIALFYCARKGLRDGDRPEDATVNALLRDSGQPDESRPVIIATVVNPSGAPMLAGLSSRPGRPERPPWLSSWLARVADPRSVTVPYRTARAKFRADGYDTVGIVPAAGTVRFPVSVGRAARCYVLTVAIGQPAGRLRVHRLRVAGGRAPARSRLPV
jgi:hypothetical protein